MHFPFTLEIKLTALENCDERLKLADSYFKAFISTSIHFLAIVKSLFILINVEIYLPQIHLDLI